MFVGWYGKFHATRLRFSDLISYGNAVFQFFCCTQWILNTFSNVVNIDFCIILKSSSNAVSCIYLGYVVGCLFLYCCLFAKWLKAIFKIETSRSVWLNMFFFFLTSYNSSYYLVTVQFMWFVYWLCSFKIKNDWLINWLIDWLITVMSQLNWVDDDNRKPHNEITCWL